MAISQQEDLAAALHLITAPTGTAEERLAKAEAYIRHRLEELTGIPQAYLDDLMGDPGVLAALGNAADPDAVYFKVDPLTGETDDTPHKLNVGSDA